MKFVLVSFFILGSVHSMALNSTAPERIKGVMLNSPVSLTHIQFSVPSTRKCEEKRGDTMEAIVCELTGATASLDDGKDKSVVQLTRLLEFHYSNTEAGNVKNTYTFLGTWKRSLYTYEVESEVVVDLAEFVGKERRYRGALEFKDYFGAKIPLDAKAE